MKHIRIIQFLTLCALITGSCFQIEIKAGDRPAVVLNEETFLENILQQAYSHAQSIDNIIGEISLLIAKGAFKDIPNVKRLKKTLEFDREMFRKILKDQANLTAIKDPELQAQNAISLLYICDAFIIHLESGLKTDFKAMDSFDVSYNNLMKRKVDFNITSESLITEVQNIEKKIASLRYNTDNAGLTWYNKIARKVDKHIVTPANKYHVPTITYYTAGIAMLGAYSLWRYSDNIAKNISPDSYLSKMTTILRSWVGEPLYRGNNGLALTSAEVTAQQQNENKDIIQPMFGKNTTIGKADRFPTIDLAAREFMTGHEPLAALITGLLLTSLREQWKTEISPALTQKKEVLWNQLRGGAYLDKSVSVSGMYAVNPQYNFDDMVGLDDVKETFSFIIQFLDNPEQFTRINTAPQQGILLTGPSRTGKSFSFECLCGEIVRMQQIRGKENAFKFLNIDAADINELGIKRILNYAKDNAPMVLFIDEIDLLGLQRVGNNALLSDFLTAMQSSIAADPSKVVILIAATNKPENLDKALRQNGRFGKEIRFEAPSKKHRIEFIIKKISNMALNINQFDPVAIAEKTAGNTFEDLESVIGHAMIMAWRNHQPLTQELIEQCIDTEIDHIITKNRNDIPENELRLLASHFAGRALATLLLDTHDQLDKVTIHARMSDIVEQGVWVGYDKKDETNANTQQKIEYGALITKQTDDTINMQKREHIINEVKTLLAGFAAEELLLGSCGYTCHSFNQERAHRLLEQLIFGGLNPEKLAKKIKDQKLEEVYNLFVQCKNEVTQLLNEHIVTLDAIADELIVNQIMTDKHVQAIVNTIENTASEETPSITSQEDTTGIDNDECAAGINTPACA